MSGKQEERKPSAQMYRTIPCVKAGEGDFVPSTHEVVWEAPVSLMVNGRQVMTAMMSPYMIREFVVGFLFTERIIHHPDEIESVKIEENMVSVLTKNPFRVLGSKKTILSGCGGTSSYLDMAKLPKVTSDLVISRENIRDGIRSVLSSPLHTLTGGVHIVGLLNADGIVAVAEDIGRHNALDRVIGFGLLHEIGFDRTFVVSSGRISSEMVRKCLYANIPLIASRGATTTLAVEIASRAGMTLIGFARGEKMNIYTGIQRVHGAPDIS